MSPTNDKSLDSNGIINKILVLFYASAVSYLIGRILLEVKKSSIDGISFNQGYNLIYIIGCIVSYSLYFLVIFLWHKKWNRLVNNRCSNPILVINTKRYLLFLLFTFIVMFLILAYILNINYFIYTNKLKDIDFLFNGFSAVNIFTNFNYLFYAVIVIFTVLKKNFTYFFAFSVALFYYPFISLLLNIDAINTGIGMSSQSISLSINEIIISNGILLNIFSIFNLSLASFLFLTQGLFVSELKCTNINYNMIIHIVFLFIINIPMMFLVRGIST